MGGGRGAGGASGLVPETGGQGEVSAAIRGSGGTPGGNGETAGAQADDAGAFCVAEDCGGVQQPVQLLRDSVHSRAVRQPAVRGGAGGGARVGAARREGADCDCAGHDAVWAGFVRSLAPARAAARLERAGGAGVDSGDVPVSEQFYG